MKILIAVPTYESITPDTFKSIYDLNKGDHACEFEFIRGYDCATARNRIAQRALDGNFDYVLMIDNDMTLPSDALLNLIEHDELVVLGYCPARNSNNVYDRRTAIFRPGEVDYTWNYPVDEFLNYQNNGLHKVEVHGGGMACSLIKTDAFRIIQYPWFKWVNYDNGASLSEDLYFCEQCIKNGIQVYVDSRVGCGHLFRYIQWPI